MCDSKVTVMFHSLIVHLLSNPRMLMLTFPIGVQQKLQGKSLQLIGNYGPRLKWMSCLIQDGLRKIRLSPPKMVISFYFIYFLVIYVFLVLAMINRLNEVSHWVSASVCLCESLEDRTKLIVKFIEVAHNLKKLNNFNGIIAILSGTLHFIFLFIPFIAPLFSLCFNILTSIIFF